MRTKVTVESIIIAIALLASAGAGLAAGSRTTVAEFRQTMKGVRTAELPAIAVQLVTQSPSFLKATNAVNVVKAAISIAPGSTLSVVGAVCGAAPEAAPAIVAAAIELEPKLKTAIALAAIDAAPAYRYEIAAVCTAPNPGGASSSQSSANNTFARADAASGINAAGINVRITPLPPPQTPPNEIRSPEVEPYLGRRDYSRP